MAEALNELPVVPAAPDRRRRHRGRFIVAYALLAVALVVAAVAFASLLTRPEPKPAPPRPQFGQFRPTTSGLEAANQIAEFVAPRYRLPSGKQMVAVAAGPLSVQETPIPAIAIQEDAQGSDGDVQVVPAENAVVYSLCGLGKDCSIPEGKPSRVRSRLVRREAIELALYTFAYVDGADSTLAFLPPPKGETASYLVYFRREDLDLDVRVKAAFVEARPPPPGQMTRAEATAIDALTIPRTFKFAFRQLQDGRPILVLEPLESTA
jgi:hypothetical protein